MRRGLGDEAFSTVHLQVLQTQLREAASTLNDILSGRISKTAGKARLAAGEDIWNQAAWWDKAREFTGIEHVRIPLEQVEAMLREESLVRAYERMRIDTGVRRYTNQASRTSSSFLKRIRLSVQDRERLFSNLLAKEEPDYYADAIIAAVSRRFSLNLRQKESLLYYLQTGKIQKRKGR